MNISADDFKQHFALLSDAALLATNPGDLVEAAQECLEAELLERGLLVIEDETAPVETGPEGEAPKSHEVAAGDQLVLIGTYTVADDASLARGLLESASIPARLENENLGLGAFQLRLMVPASFEQEALDILEYEISDEDLAAQAEAAGGFDEESEDEAESDDPQDNEEPANESQLT